MTTRHYLWTLYVPINGNDGRPISQAKLKQARDEITGFAGGCTILGQSAGTWVSPEQCVVTDVIVPIQAVTPADAESRRFFTRLARDLAVLLVQSTIFVTCMPIRVVGG